jgi:hypothetical protein
MSSAFTPSVGISNATTTVAGAVKLPSGKVDLVGAPPGPTTSHGSTNTKIRRFLTTVTNTGTSITYADSATLGGTFTINESGVYSITYNDSGAVGDGFGISLNSANLTTAVNSLTTAERLISVVTSVAGRPLGTSLVVTLAAGDVIRAHTNGLVDAESAAAVRFVIQQIMKF